MSPEEVRERVLAWVEEAVVGLQLCPFAAPVLRAGGLEVRVSEAEEPEDAVHAALDAAIALLEGARPATTTTLVAYSRALASFEDYLAAVRALEEALSEAGAEGVLQVASFHPDYRFAGSEAEDLANWTNRSPVPVVHLLRESDVSAAVAEHSDPEGIPAANIRRLRELGPAGLRAIWSRFSTQG